MGVIRIHQGVPVHANPWGWFCGFYPGSYPKENTSGNAATFEEARAAFEQAWAEYLPKRTEADFQAYRDQRDWTIRKYEGWERGWKKSVR